MKRCLFVLLFIFSIILFTGCSKKEEKNMSELDKILEQNNYIIVDVRTFNEYIESHVKGAINIPYDEIDINTNLDKTKTILVYCKSGARSGKAYDTLKSLGYDVYNMGAFASIDLEKE